MSTVNGDAPAVGEHAYCLDYQNRRGDAIRAFLDHLFDREFTFGNLNRA
jgi:hypothetical protein